MSDFPALRPSQRSITMGQAPIKQYQTLNGVVVRRSFGNVRFNYELSLSFNNANEEIVAQLWDHYHDNQTLQKGFSIPDEVFSGYSTNESLPTPVGLISRMNRMSEIVWHYAEPPQIESVALSYSNVQIKIIGQLRYTPS
jgi:hypothetical protein